MTTLLPRPAKVEMDFTAAKLSGFSGWSVLGQMAGRMDLPRLLSSVSVKKRARCRDALKPHRLAGGGQRAAYRTRPAASSAVPEVSRQPGLLHLRSTRVVAAARSPVPAVVHPRPGLRPAAADPLSGAGRRQAGAPLLLATELGAHLSGANRARPVPSENIIHTWTIYIVNIGG